MIIEHKVNSFIKVTYICDNELCTAIGDLPADPWCFKDEVKLEVKNSKVLWSEPLNISNIVVKLCATLVENEYKSVMFVAKYVKPSLDPSQLLKTIRDFIRIKCSGE